VYLTEYFPNIELGVMEKFVVWFGHQTLYYLIFSYEDTLKNQVYCDISITSENIGKKEIGVHVSPSEFYENVRHLFIVFENKLE